MFLKTEPCMLDYVIFWRIRSHMYGWLDCNKWNEIEVGGKIITVDAILLTKTGNARINVILRRDRVATVAMEK